MSYEKGSIYYFGSRLLETQDLDPVYVMLHYAQFPGVGYQAEMRMSWMLAYFCFYNVGVACYITDPLISGDVKEYWRRFLVAAENELPSPIGGRWPRAAERRHFRGEACVKAVHSLHEKYGDNPAGFVKYVIDLEDTVISYRDILKRVKEHHLFGNWIAFKVGDMLERVLNIPVDFTESDVFFFDDPKKGALLAYPTLNLGYTTDDDNERIKVVSHHLLNYFLDQGFAAPPTHARGVNLQEVETILCKWKSHMNGHYPIGKDTLETTKSLWEWRHESHLAAIFYKTAEERFV